MTTVQYQAYYDNNAQARWVALISVCLSLFIASLTLSAANIAVPSIAMDLQADAVAVSWIPTALLWGTIILLLPAGRLADIKGRKKLYITGIVFFGLVSLFIFWVDSIESLLVLRVLQGMSTALIYGPGVAIVGSVFANSNRGTALGVTASTVYFGLSCGPLLGGWITEHIGWRGVFWMPVPVILLSLILVFTHIKGDWKSEVPEPLDWVGSLLFAAWISAFFIGVSELPDPLHIGLVVLGILLLVVFLKQQSRAPYPLVKLQVLRLNKVFSHSILSSVMMYGANFSVVFLLSLYLQYIHGLSPSDAGQLILIQTFIMMILAPISGRLSDQYEPRLIATMGCLIFAMGFLVLIGLDMQSSNSTVIVALILLGTGFGFFSSPNNNAALGAAPKDKLSIASALVNLSRTMGNMFSTAVVMMLMALILGDAKIQSDHFPELMLVIKIAFVVSFVSAIGAAFVSYSRGKVH